MHAVKHRGASPLLRTALISPASRPLRFVGTGLSAAALQLGLLASMTHRGWPVLAANLISFLISAQFNFVLSSMLTWRDRVRSGPLIRRWLVFHVSISAMALLNMAVFAASRLFVPTLAASALGILAGAAGNYIAGDRLIFRRAASSTSNPEKFAA